MTWLRPATQRNVADMTDTKLDSSVASHWIDGQEVQTADMTTDVVNPANVTVVATVPAGTAEDVDRAVAAARAALTHWASTDPAARAQAIQHLADRLTERSEEVAAAVSVEIGAPITLARFAHAALPPLVAASVAGLAQDFPWTEELGNSLLLREPVGVVGAITPWNFPLQQIMTKLAPALLAGNAVVWKPPELAPLTARILAEAARDARIPDGVVNVVYGLGSVVGEAIAIHPDIDMISFTGSTKVGKRVSVLAANNVKRVALELGGKSASVVLNDADLELAVDCTRDIVKICGSDDFRRPSPIRRFARRLRWRAIASAHVRVVDSVRQFLREQSAQNAVVGRLGGHGEGALSQLAVGLVGEDGYAARGGLAVDESQRGRCRIVE